MRKEEPGPPLTVYAVQKDLQHNPIREGGIVQPFDYKAGRPLPTAVSMASVRGHGKCARPRIGQLTLDMLVGAQ